MQETLLAHIRTQRLLQPNQTSTRLSCIRNRYFEHLANHSARAEEGLDGYKTSAPELPPSNCNYLDINFTNALEGSRDVINAFEVNNRVILNLLMGKRSGVGMEYRITAKREYGERRRSRCTLKSSGDVAGWKHIHRITPCM